MTAVMNRLSRKDEYQTGFAVCETPEDRVSFMRALCKTDIFFLLTEVCGRKDVDVDWIFDRCMDVQRDPDGFLDVWARFHYKSTIQTFAKTIQDILCNPNETIGILSFNRPIARGFLRQIKYEFESNEKLKLLFPEILWDKPKRDAQKWSEDEGIIVQRTSNPKEATLEAYGLTDGQPSSKHYSIRIYDDMVSPDSVATPDAIRKTTDAWEMSLNLATLDNPRQRHCGTFYHYNDTYTQIIDRGSVKVRKFPATDDGTRDGNPVLVTRDRLAEIHRDMGPYTFATQMLLDPAKEAGESFRAEWLNYWEAKNLAKLNTYILCDPASEKKEGSDYTVFVVIGLGSDRNYYVIRILRDRLNMKERCSVLFKLHQEYKPREVGYEKYGMMSDLEYFKERMEYDNYRFNIRPVAGGMKKNDRIKRILPFAAEGRWYMPSFCPYTDYTGRTQDLTKVFLTDEWLPFPYGKHDDILDCMSRIVDVSAVFPQTLDKDMLTRKEQAILKMMKTQEAEVSQDGYGYDPLYIGL